MQAKSAFQPDSSHHLDDAYVEGGGQRARNPMVSKKTGTLEGAGFFGDHRISGALTPSFNISIV